MQVKLNLIVGAAAIVLGGTAYAQDLVVKIGHVGPTSGAIAHLGKVKTSVSCMYINRLDQIDLGVLREMAVACLAHMRELYPED